MQSQYTNLTLNNMYKHTLVHTKTQRALRQQYL